MEHVLSDMPVGCTGRIVSLEAPVDDVERLQVMGLCAGRWVQVVKAGDPMIVRVMETRIGLAARLARLIRVSQTLSCELSQGSGGNTGAITR